MRLRRFLPLFVALVSLLPAACNSRENSATASTGTTATPSTGGEASQASEVPADGVPRITVVELARLVDQKKAVIVDVRNKETYDDEHIKGAISIPVGEIESRAGELPKDKTIVLYCS